MEKRFNFFAAGRGNYECAEDAPVGSCEIMENLRNVGRILCPVGKPARVGHVADGERLLVAHDTADGLQVIGCRGNAVVWHSTVLSGGTVVPRDTVLGYAGGEVRCAGALGRTVLVGCTGGDVALHYDGGGYRVLDRRRAMPVLRLTATDESVATAQVVQVQFAGGYSRWRNPLLPEDVGRLTDAVLEAVERLEGVATASASKVYPYIARYAVRLTDGSYLAVSAPVVIGSGLPFRGEYRTAVTNDGVAYTGTEAFGITASTFRLGVEVEECFGTEWDSLIAGVDVLVADEVTPLLRDRQVEYRCETSSSSSTSGQQALLMLKLGSLGGEELMRQLLGAARWRVCYTITDFASLREGRAVLRPARGSVAAGVVAACERQMPECRSTVAVVQHNRRLFAACDAMVPVSAWGASAVLRVDTLADTTYEAAVVARIATPGGERLTLWRGSGKGRPVAVNALLSYPDPRATSVEVRVLEGGAERVCTATLSNSGSIACSFTPQLDERELELTGSASLMLPDVQPLAGECAGLVVESREMNALVSHALHQVCDSRIVALAADLHHTNNSIGTPVYAFATSGVYALPYRAASGGYSPGVIISRRRIVPGTCAVNTAGTLVFADDMGELCAIDRYKVAVVARGVGDVAQVGYVERSGEVWLLRRDGTVAAAAADKWLVHTLTGNYASMFPLPGVGVYVASADGGLCDASVEEPVLAPVRLLTEPFTPTPGRGFRPVEVTVGITADLMQGSIVVRGERGRSCHGMVLCRLRVDGEVSRPIRLRLLSPRLRTMRVEVEGKLSGDAVIGDWGVNFF